MNATKDLDGQATAEQLELLRRLGVRVSVNVVISRATARASIEFHHATDKQLVLLRRLGYSTDGPITKKRASELIEQRLAARGGSWGGAELAT